MLGEKYNPIFLSKPLWIELLLVSNVDILESVLIS